MSKYVVPRKGFCRPDLLHRVRISTKFWRFSPFSNAQKWPFLALIHDFRALEPKILVHPPGGNILDQFRYFMQFFTKIEGGCFLLRTFENCHFKNKLFPGSPSKNGLGSNLTPPSDRTWKTVYRLMCKPKPYHLPISSNIKKYVLVIRQNQCFILL